MVLTTSLRTIALGSTLLLSAICLTPKTALAQRQDFVFYNNSDRTVRELYVSPWYSDSWEEDVLGSDVLFSGRRTRIRFYNSNGDTCFFDIKIVFRGGRSMQKTRFNLCQLNQVSVF
jgi:hypothetical protein